MKSLAIAFTTLLGFAAPAFAQEDRGLYLQVDAGFNLAPGLTVDGTDNDWGTKCDLIINPDAAEVIGDECAAAPPPSEWSNTFDATPGSSAGMALGYRFGALRIAAEFLARSVTYDARSGDTDVSDAVTLAKQEQELELAVAGINELRSKNLFVNVYYDLPKLYVGAGVGVGETSLYYFSHWKRNDDPSRITTFQDPLLRAKLAGTTTIGEARHTDSAIGYQLLVGMDRELGSNVLAGLQIRWVNLGTFEGEPREWDQLRSHESSVGRGDAVVYRVTVPTMHYWAMSFGLKYHF